MSKDKNTSSVEDNREECCDRYRVDEVKNVLSDERAVDNLKILRALGAFHESYMENEKRRDDQIAEIRGIVEKLASIIKRSK